MTESEMRILEEKLAKSESIYAPSRWNEESFSKHIFTDRYGNWFYADYKRTGYAVMTQSGTSATGDTAEEAIKNAIPIERIKIAYWKAFFVCRDTGRRPRGCPFFKDLIERDTQSDDDEPTESFGGPLVDAARGQDGGEQ
jgi:hypothetical protein